MIARALHHFRADVIDPRTGEIESCEIGYTVEDVGVMMRPDEKLRPVIKSVVGDDGAGILALIGEYELEGIERRAMEEWRAGEF